MTDESETPPEEPAVDLNFHTDMPVGEILRRTRVHYGQTLQQIEGILRIRAFQLDAIEQNDAARLPGRVYAIGFVRSYSEYLGLDGDKMVHLFKEQSGGKQKKPELSFPVPASESKVPNLKIIGGSLFGFLVLVGFVSFMMFPERSKTEIPAVPEELTKSQLNEAPALVGDANPVQAVTTTQINADGTPVETATPAQEPAAPTNRIILEIIDSTWVEIKNASGASILRQVLKPGDIYLVPPEPGLLMATGNAGGIRIKVDGKELPPLGEAGQIKRKIALDPALLLPGAPPIQPSPPAPVQ